MTRTSRHNFFLFAIFASIYFFGYPSTAQKPEKVLAIATYRFSQQEDTAIPSSVRTQYMNLYIGRRGSLYRRAPGDSRDSSVVHRTAAAAGQSIEVNEDGNPPGFYFYPETHRVIENEKMFMFNYLFEVPYPDIDWKVYTDTLNVAGFRCQMAKGKWKGRSWTVWFCPDLPFRYGPWKLNGLPGTILQATDSTHQISFSVERVKRNTNPDLFIQLPADHPVRLSEQEYHRLRKLFAENPRAYLESVFGPGAMSSMIIDPSFHDVKTSNPIELNGDN
jgi:GLPGLI family protein